MDWPEFLESSNPQGPTFDLYSASPHDYNREVTAQTNSWSLQEKQFFENAFSSYNNLGSQTFFEFVASKFPDKSMEEMKNYYINLFKDVEMENPPQNNDFVVVDVVDHHDQQHQQVTQEDNSSDLNGGPPQVENTHSRRRRGIPWTEGEHQLFLMGLNKFGKGDWKSISRYYVVSKTPTQVASHAQKYFCRMTSQTPMERRRPSINDIQTVTLTPKRTTTTVTTTPQTINNIIAYNNNCQVGSSSMPCHYSNYNFGGSTFGNNSNGNFGRFHRGEASSSNSSVMGQNNNYNNNNMNFRRPVSPRPFLSMYLSSTKGNNSEM